MPVKLKRECKKIRGEHVKLLVTSIVFLLFVGFVSPMNAQDVDHWETVVFANDTWMYFIGTSEPPANWRQLAFDDAGWSSGQGGFGYGDNDDETVVPAGTISLYLRIKFDIKDASTPGAAMFHIDYDDAFVAYLNDLEIGRSAGLTDEHPSYSTTSSSNHDAQMVEGGEPTGMAVPTTYLQQGENVLAIQVHNASATSSDMSAIPFLSVGLTTSEQQYRPVPAWFREPFVFQSSNLPILVLNTGGRDIRDEPKIDIEMGLINNESGINNIGDPFNECEGYCGIERRGNASQSFDVVQGKWSYSMETRNADGSNNNVKLLGMPKDNDWILSADFIDKTLIRNALAYEMARSLGRWAPRTRHVELVLNGEYQGVYLLLEKIKPDNNRVDIAKMDSSDISGEDVTGGYIWDVQQADGTDIDFGERRVLKYPKPDQVQPEQLEYIKDYDDEFRSVMRRSYYDDGVRGYHNYIDVPSFIDEAIIQEITKNSDAYGWSGFFHKDRGGLINAGPVWDFDQSMSNSTHKDGWMYDKWVIGEPDGSHPEFWFKLWETPNFKRRLANQWFEYRQDQLSLGRIYEIVDSLATYLDEAQQRNFMRWPILGVEIWRSTPGVQDRDTYQKEVDYLKDFLEDHTEWIDEQLDPFTSVEQAQNADTQTSLKINLSPNPMHNGAYFSYSLDRQGHVSIRVVNILGQEVHKLVNTVQSPGQHAFRWDGRDFTGRAVANGLYFYELRVDNVPLLQSKFVKF